MLSRLTLAAVAMALTLPVAANARNLENFLPTKALPGGQEFEVLNRPGTGPALFWCGAGAHAHRKLNLGPNERIYLVQGRAPSVTRPGWSAVTFTVNPQHPVVDALPLNGSDDLLLSISKQGYALSVDSARQYCFDGPDIIEP